MLVTNNTDQGALDINECRLKPSYIVQCYGRKIFTEHKCHDFAAFSINTSMERESACGGRSGAPLPNIYYLPVETPVKLSLLNEDIRRRRSDGTLGRSAYIVHVGQHMNFNFELTRKHYLEPFLHEAFIEKVRVVFGGWRGVGGDGGSFLFLCCDLFSSF